MITLAMLVKDPPLDRLASLLNRVAPVVGETVVVVDDRTRDPLPIKAMVDLVVPFTWIDDFAAARNAALPHVTGDWVLHLDPDEWPSDDMLAFLSMVDRSEWRDHVDWKDGRYFDPKGYLFWFRNWFDGVQGPEWEEHWHCRLFRREGARWYKTVHEQVAFGNLTEQHTRNTPLLPKAPRAARVDHYHVTDPASDALYAQIEARA